MPHERSFISFQQQQRDLRTDEDPAGLFSSPLKPAGMQWKTTADE